eukprot:749242-Hanusia_phi.AAC.8
MATCAICLEAEEGEEGREELREAEGEKQIASIDCCSHKFCYDCIMTWARRKRTCPVCRATISSITVRGAKNKETRTLSIFDALMEEYGETFSDDDEEVDEDDMFDDEDDDLESTFFLPLPFSFFHHRHMYPMFDYDTDDSFVVTDEEDFDDEVEEDSEFEDEEYSETESSDFVPSASQLQVLSAVIDQQRRARAMQDLQQRIDAFRDRTILSSANLQQGNSTSSQSAPGGTRSDPICVDEPIQQQSFTSTM